MSSASFAAAARNNLDAVYRYLLTMTKDSALAEDLTSETFERALRRWHRFDPRRAGEKTWLLMLARSAALDHFRAEARRLRREERFVSEQDDEQDDEQADIQVDLGLTPALEAALAELSAAEREVIALRVIVELDGDTAARVLGISRTSCSTRLSRALRKLEERVSAHVAV
jgi:RNA polymerase sigma-70 factor, ECF subfamily